MIRKEYIIMTLILGILLISGCVPIEPKEPIVISGNQINESEYIIFNETINDTAGIITEVNSTVYNETNITGNYSNLTNST